MQQFTVSIAHGRAAALHRKALASLPAHFRIVESGLPDVVLVAGDGSINIERARLVVVDDLAAIRASLALPTRVVPAFRYAPHLAFGHLPFSLKSSDFVLIDMMTTVSPNDRDGLRFSLIEQLAILRVLTGGTVSLLNVHRTSGGYLADAAVSHQAAAVTLTGTVSPIGASLQLSANTLTSRIEIALNGEALARPARIRRSDAHGSIEASPVHQNCHRMTWLAVHQALAEAGSSSNDCVKELREAVEATQRWFEDT